MPSKAALRFIRNGKNPPPWLKSLRRERMEQQQRWCKEGTPFKMGQKNLYLPNFTVALLRTPNLSPYWAQFRVPLSFNKLDLRDYLFHAYKVRIRSARSFIVPSRVIHRTIHNPTYHIGRKLHYRPQPIKKMMVEMENPFVWPAEPSKEELEDKWESRKYEESMQDAGMERYHRSMNAKSEERQAKKKLERDMARLRRQAERLLTGQDKWGDGEETELVLLR